MYLHKVSQHPILQELALFQTHIGQREKIYLPTRGQPYYGKLEKGKNPHLNRSQYHEGLLTSRALASHELVLLMHLVERLALDKYGLHLSLENDGLLFLTRTSKKEDTFFSLDSFLRARSHEFLGVEIPLERKQ